jgi:predicted phosphate transport protein (TIGR00153 family)
LAISQLVASLSGANPTMFQLIPKDNSFFKMYAEMSDNLIAGARALVDLFENYSDLENKTTTIKAIERRGDEITHSILKKLNQTFITPFDREDMHRLASSLDDVLDFIHAAAERTTLYKITIAPSAAAKLSHLILKQTEELKIGVSLLQENGHVLDHCVEINRLENEADTISGEAIAALFEREKDPINLIKVKELIEVLETATDKAEDVANVLETVVLKST